MRRLSWYFLTLWGFLYGCGPNLQDSAPSSSSMCTSMQIAARGPNIYNSEAIILPESVETSPNSYYPPQQLRIQLHNARVQTHKTGNESCSLLYKINESLSVYAVNQGTHERCVIDQTPPTNPIIAGYYHTHPSNLSFAPDDIALCLQVFALSRGSMCFLTTSESQYLLVNTKQTLKKRMHYQTDIRIENFNDREVRRMLVLIQDQWDRTYAQFKKPCGDVGAVHRAVSFLAETYHLAFYKAGGDFRFHRLYGGWIPTQ